MKQYRYRQAPTVRPETLTEKVLGVLLCCAIGATLGVLLALELSK